MHKEYFNLLIAGFEQADQETLSHLLTEINKYTPNIDLRIQTSQEYDDIINALSESFYKVCLLNSELKTKINHKIVSEIQNRLNIQNKTTAIININCTETNNDLEYIDIHNINSQCIPEISLEQLNGYWLAYSIKSAIEKLQLQKEIKRLSHYDNLTGLINRNLYLNHLNHALAMAEREKRFCTLIYLDINKFKQINEEHGIKTGDAVLIECAQRIKKSIRSIDIAARLGSDEFAILLENCKLEEANRIIMDLKQAMNLPFHIGSDKFNIECSIDHACYPDSGGNNANDKSLFLSKVRQAHYMAKT